MNSKLEDVNLNVINSKSDEELILHERLLLRANELLKELNYNNDETILNELYQIIHILTLEGYKFN